MTDAERIAELERTVANLRRRLLALADVLPVELLPYLERDPATFEGHRPPNDMFAGWVETPTPQPSTMTAELEQLWKRM